MRKTQDLVETTQSLAAGDLGARTQIASQAGEFGLLAAAIDHLAVALCARETERDSAERIMKDYAADLERSNRDLLDFANIASHDMQEPLRKIQIFGDLLSARYARVLDDRGQDYIQRMHDAAERMQTLLSGLLAYSRISTRGEPLSTVDLNKVAKNVLANFEMEIEEQKAEPDDPTRTGESPCLT